MSLMSTTKIKLAAAATAVAVAGGAGALALTSGAFASSSPAAVQTTSATATTHAHHGHKGRHHHLLRRSDYATVQVKRHGSWTTFVLNRGNLQAVTPFSITVKRPDGGTAFVKLNSTTKYRGVSGESSLRVGNHVSVISVNGTAVKVAQKMPKSSTTAA